LGLVPPDCHYHGLLATVDFQRQKHGHYGGPIVVFVNDLWIGAEHSAWVSYDHIRTRGDLSWTSGSLATVPEFESFLGPSGLIPDVTGDGMTGFLAKPPTFNGSYEIGGVIGAVVTGLTEANVLLGDQYYYGRAPVVAP
jgi:hypothetical protein